MSDEGILSHILICKNVEKAKESLQEEYAKERHLFFIKDEFLIDDARSPTVLESIKATVYEALSNALHPTKQKVIWLGTPFNANDPLYEAIESGSWYSNVYPICEKFPCSKDEFKGAWEDRFTYEFIKRKYETAQAVGRGHGFYQELMLQIMSDDEKIFYRHHQGEYYQGLIKYNYPKRYLTLQVQHYNLIFLLVL
jgi:hypothetical protein